MGGAGLLVSIQDAACRATQRVDLHNFIGLSGKTEEEETRKKRKKETQRGLFDTGGISKARGR